MTLSDTARADTICRLCGGRSSYRFDLNVLHKHDVKYYECEECHSLQTENPFWLNEAYDQSLSSLDTGAGQRNLHNLAASYAVCKLFKANNAIDIGGGDGLLCRLLRDYGINCFVKDKYANPTYAQGFTEPDFDTPDLVIAFEVLEHFANPRLDLDALFRLNSNILLASTAIYTNEQKDWWYLAPENGQHVFFYSKRALDLIANTYGYKLIISGGFILFAKNNVLTPAKSVLARLLLNRYACRTLRSLVVLLPTPGIWKDHLIQKEKSGPDLHSPDQSGT
jgi:Methyltransferase domain